MQKSMKADDGLEKAAQSRRVGTPSILFPKKIIIAIGVMGAFALAVPVIIGHYAEKEVRAAFDYLSTQSPILKLRIANYDKGLFTSKAMIDIILDVPDFSQNMRGLQRVEFSATMLISHGPITFRSADGSWQVRPALAVGHLFFSPATYVNQFLKVQERREDTGDVNRWGRVIAPISPMAEYVTGLLSEQIRSQILGSFGQIGEQIRASGEALLIEAFRHYPPIKVSFTRPFDNPDFSA